MGFKIKDIFLPVVTLILIIYLIRVEFIFIESSSFFMSSLGFLSIWFLYELSITGIEESIDSHISKIVIQFNKGLDLSLNTLKLVEKVNKDWLVSLEELLSQYVSVILELNKANILSYRGLVIFFDLALIEYLIFSHSINVKIKYFLNKIPILNIVKL